MNIDAVVKARIGSPLLYLELYCDNSDCAVREVHLRVKDYDNTFVADVRRGVRCPVCRKPLKQHWAHTAIEQDIEERYLARCSVNSQMRERDYCATNEGRALFVETADQMMDDRLPETPDGWFAKERVK